MLKYVTPITLITSTLLVLALNPATPLSFAQQEAPPTTPATIPNDGPYVFWRDAETAILLSYCDGEVIEKIIENITTPMYVSTPCSPLTKILLEPTPPSTTQATWEMPKRLLAISDLEGNYATLVAFLKANNVVDENGDWAWGDGHLVFNGDIVDRGDQVTEILWYIRMLEHQANAAGGHVHYILGNHETMVMAGDLRYIHPKYAATSKGLGHTYDALFGPNTDFGRWFRTRNTVTQIGPLLFVHAGYSPALEQLKLDPEKINQQIRTSLGPPKWPAQRDLTTELIWHQQGPMWYRGYFPQYAAQWGGLPTDEQLQEILARHQAKHIVVGHTVVDDIRWLDTNNRLIGIDVKWTDPSEGEGLLLEDGALYRVTMTGKKIPFVSMPKTPKKIQ